MIEKLKGYLGRSEFAKGVLVLTSGTVLAQFIPLLIAPILTRLYTPEEFATFGLFSAVTSILGVVSTGKYEFAIMLPERKRDALAVTLLSVIITFAFGLLIALVIFFTHSEMIEFLGNKDFGFWLNFVPMAVIFVGLYQTLNFWKSREKEYLNLSQSKVVRSIFSNIVNLVLGFYHIGVTAISSLGLISGLVIGQIVELLILVRSDSSFFFRIKGIIKLSKREIKSLAIRYFDFPKYDVPSELMITASIQLPVLLLNRFFEQAVVGRYFYAHKVLSLPLSLIGNSIAQVLFTQLASLRNSPEALSLLVYKTYDRLITFGAILFALVGVFGPELFEFVFGPAWRQAGVFAAIISPWLLFNFAGSPLTIVFSAVEKQKQMFLWFTVMFALRIVSLFVGFLYFKNVYYSILFFSASGTLFYFGLNFYIVSHLAKVKIKDFLQSTFIKPSLILSGALFIKFLLSIIYK